MVYLHKILHENGRMIYEYGGSEEEYVGTIEFRVDLPAGTKSEDRDIKLTFYGDNSFSMLTSWALQGVAKFVRENEFPDNYLRASH